MRVCISARDFFRFRAPTTSKLDSRNNDREPKKNVVRVFPIESKSNFQRERTRETNEEAPELLADRHQRAREEIAPPFEEKKTRREDTSTF